MRRASLIAICLLALASASAEASRKLSITSLTVPPTVQAGERLEISGTVRNAGDEQARVTVRAYLVETVGQLRLTGGKKVPVGAGRESSFALSPEIHDDTDAGEYEIAVCVRRVNKRGPTSCSSSPLTVE